MRILYVCADRGISPHGDKGASAHVRAVTAAFATRGHAVTLACRRTDGRNALAAGVTVVVMPEDQRAHTAWLRRQVRAARADVVIERYSLSSGPAGEAARRCGVPLLLEVNAPLVDEAARFRGLECADSWRRWEAGLLAKADHIVAVSQAVAQHAITCGAPAARVSVVANGADPARFANAVGDTVRLRYGLEDCFVVGFCGSLKPWHGVTDLVEAVARLPERTRLLVVGDGPERGSVRFRALSLGVQDRVVMTGAVHERDVPAHLAAMDVGAAAYKAVDGFYFSPLKVVEYCAAGLPVVATAQGEMTGLGGAAVLVPPGDPAALAGALATLAEQPERRAFMSRAARAYAAGRTWDDTARRIEEVIAGVALEALRGAGYRAAG